MPLMHKINQKQVANYMRYPYYTPRFEGASNCPFINILKFELKQLDLSNLIRPFGRGMEQSGSSSGS